MKPIVEQDHYEVLEVARDAGLGEIERAYRMACVTYQDGSLAAYSMFEDGDVGAIRQRVEEAYGVLSDAAARQRYDASLRTRSSETGAEAVELSIELASRRAAAQEVAPELEGFEELEDIEMEGASAAFDGGSLRRARLRRGLELSQIADVTKISSTYLRFLEEESFDELPAPVYVRGFVKAFARCVGVDAETAARRYMEHYRARGGQRGAAWFRGAR